MLGLLALMIALSQWASAGMIYAKAWLAPLLIERAYTTSQREQTAIKPWPWADHHPVARLTFPRGKLERWVLNNDSGNALAFGPGMASGVRPGERGLAMVSGHRDTHFRFLRELRQGDEIRIEFEGQGFSYRVTDTVVADAREGILNAPLPQQGLLLVTCYPFDAITPGGPLRFVAIAEEVNAAPVLVPRH
ncbi:MAG: class GN sortase [Congregibacter sp.]